MYTEADIQSVITAIQHSIDESNQNIEETRNISDPLLIQWKEGCVFGLQLALDEINHSIKSGLYNEEEGELIDEF